MAEKKSKILNTTVCIIYMLFGFAFAQAPQPGTVLACELYPDVHPGTIDTTGSFNQLVAIWENLIGKTYISEDQILKYIQEAPLPFNFELSINHSLVIKGNHTNFQIQRSSFVIKASELYQLDIQAAIEKEKELTENLNVATEEKKKLEEQIAILQKKCSDSDAKHAEKVAELESELEEFRTNASTLEISLQAAIEKEKELTASLNVATEEKKKLEEALKSSGEELSEAKTLVEVLRNDLQAAGLRESEIMEKLEHVNLKNAEKVVELTDEKKKLTQDLASFESKLSDLKSEKDKTYEQLQTSKKAVEDLTQQVASERQKFQDQIPSSLLEDNNLLKEKLKEAKENLNAGISEKSIRVKELEELESQLKQEVESVKADFAEKVREGDVLNEQLIKLQKELESVRGGLYFFVSVFKSFVSAIKGKIIFW